jgi:hypothetical protein
MAQHLDQVLRGEFDQLEGQFQIETCVIATTATEPGDDVYITLPNGDAPSERVLVTFWRMSVDLDVGGDLVPRFPVRGRQGFALYADTGEVCLLF